MNRTVFLVDGFNVYHSLVQAQRDADGESTKWLDLRSLCDSFLPIAGRVASERASLERIIYFSAPPTHRAQGKQDRHTLYMTCLRATGISVELGRFKSKQVWCSNCKQHHRVNEEKETDVAIATRLFEVCHSDEAETVIILSGDTDLAPAVRTCRRLFPTKLIFFGFPYRRTNSELAQLAPESFSIKLRSCLRHQLPDPFELRTGAVISKPDSW